MMMIQRNVPLFLATQAFGVTWEVRALAGPFETQPVLALGGCGDGRARDAGRGGGGGGRGGRRRGGGGAGGDRCAVHQFPELVLQLGQPGVLLPDHLRLLQQLLLLVLQLLLLLQLLDPHLLHLPPQRRHGRPVHLHLLLDLGHLGARRSVFGQQGHGGQRGRGTGHCETRAVRFSGQQSRGKPKK